MNRIYSLSAFVIATQRWHLFTVVAGDEATAKLEVLTTPGVQLDPERGIRTVHVALEET